MEHDTLARALEAIRAAEARGKQDVFVRPTSKIIKEVMDILKKEEYIKGYEIFNEKKKCLKIYLCGAINNVRAIKPRYPVTLAEYEKFESRYLPAKDFGRLIVSTPKGIMTHIDAKAKKLGGVLIAFVY